MNINYATIEELLIAPEGEHVQFKEAKSRFDYSEAVKICCGLSNCGGGQLVLGITDKRPRMVVGSNAFDQPERTRKGLIDKLHVMVDFRLFESDGKRVLAFNVASRPAGLPVQADGVAWWYEADSLMPMPEEVRRSIYAENGFDFSGEICRSATLDDLDDVAVENFRERWILNSGNARLGTLSKEQLLRDCEVLANSGLTYAALILFGTKKSVRKHLPRAEVIFEYRSSEAAGPAAQREEFTEGFFNYYDRIWELVNLRNDKQHYQDRLFVLPIDTFNESVVREALLNAISHRDYQLAGSVFVRQYRDRLVLESPGGFPYGITVENILDRQSPRNLLIAQIFQLCGLVERSGQGMNLMYEFAVREAKPLPDFSGTDAYFVKLTLNGQVVSKRMLSMIKKIGDETLAKMTTDDYVLLSMLFADRSLGDIQLERFAHLVQLGIVEKTPNGIKLANGETLSVANRLSIGGLSATTTDRKTAIKSFIENHGEAKTADLVEAFALSDGYIRALLREMVSDGTLDKVGDKRYASYRLREKHEKTTD